jgi:hypothetical protein
VQILRNQQAKLLEILQQSVASNRRLISAIFFMADELSKLADKMRLIANDEMKVLESIENDIREMTK